MSGRIDAPGKPLGFQLLWMKLENRVIVDPDFPDHWKTRLLVGELDGDEAAPTYLLRIWGHCQNRRQWIFEGITSQALKALCRYPGEASKLEKALVDTGFVKRENSALVIVHWDVYNATLIASWENGKRGGRPRKEAVSGEEEKPSDNPRVPDRRRGEKIGEEKISNPDRSDRRASTALEPPPDLKPTAVPSIPLDRSDLKISGDEAEPDTGQAIDLARVDWSQVVENAIALGKRVSPKTENDRRAWFRYAVMCEELFTLDWLMSAAEEVANSKEHRRGKPAHLVAILKSRAKELGFNSATFDGIARRIEIPAHVWKSQVLELRK